VGPAHKLFSNRDKMSHDPRTVMRQIVEAMAAKAFEKFYGEENQ
jgi:hypothetical protein